MWCRHDRSLHPLQSREVSDQAEGHDRWNTGGGKSSTFTSYAVGAQIIN